ncbi:E3 ubiquitin-protein ligase ubr3 isoform X2 [Pangasianodon hypophthalmus]|uniref:E3 ubiquitin-protein ligase ubr3 isoform X2 n=1 Tax=Pangasianodon hypophthalmus TaxID=310915 RepID=UPI0023072C1B|nr:E3 ubiquitin-protein ligase ubr3 isoform X2 [Pangasianodon hypophthalmus]
MAASLLRRDKKATAAHLKADLNRTDNSSGIRQLQELLDNVLNPEKPAADTEALDWCKYLLAGGDGFEEFCKTVRSYDNATLCGLVWTANFVAYRCRTCGISPCMSLCAECFNNGDHTGHDFNMFRSQAGGACDCGDSNVMRESGFCIRHRLRTGENVPSVPRDLLLMSEMVLPRFIISIIQYLRDGYTESESATDRDLQKVLQQLEPQISFLEDLTKMGGAMRTVLTKILTNQQTFKELSMGQEENMYAKRNYEKYLSALKNSGLVSVEDKGLAGTGAGVGVGAGVGAAAAAGAADSSAGAGTGALGLLGATAAVSPNGENKEEDQDGGQSVGQRKRVKLSSSTKDPSIMDILKHKCFLEELLFWTIKYEFPQKMVTFLLNMLPDQDYKITFTKTFVQHYAFIMKTLMKSHESDTMSNRIVHISVQLFSNEELARHVTEECQLLDIMVTVLLYMMESCLIKSELQDEENNRHMVVNCGEALLKNNTYWPLVSDFINILSHQSVAKRFLEDHSLLMLWMSFVSFFQGMNLNKRELNEHVEFESQTYYAAFAAELEACAQPMWGLLTHCKVKETQEYTKTVARYCLETLQMWFDAIGFVDEPAPNQITFHLPLHRYYAMFLSKAVKCQGLDLDSLLPDQEMLMKIMVHPLQIQACLSEIHSNMWVRNGLQIKGQAMTYVQSHFCNSMIDPDIFLLQVCASRLDPDYFISSVFERFKVVDLLTMASQHQNAVLDAEQERPMLEGALTFLVILCSLRVHLGMTDDEILRAEMVSQLCMNDRTHSSLLDLIPENPNPKSGIVPGSCSFEEMLSAVADFKAPVSEPGGSMQQGMYTPKAEVWEKEFDPIMVILRTVYRRDVQSAMDRYSAFLKQSGIHTGNPWPPYKERTPLHPCYRGLVRLLHCKTLHIVIFTLLYKIWMDHQNMSEHVLCMVLYLVELGLDNHAQEDKEDEEPCIEEHCHDSWFPGTSLISNLHHVINFVRVRVPETAPEVERKRERERERERERQRETPPSTSTDASTFGQSSRRLTGNWRENLREAQLFSLVAERRRKFQEIINRSNHEANQAVRPKSYSRWLPPGSPPQMVTEILEIRESMLSLLVKLHQKLSAKQNSLTPSWLEEAEPAHHTHGDGITAIERILAKAASRSRHSKRCLQEICGKVCPPVPPKKNSPGDKKSMDKEERRQRARERQQKLLAEFASRQKSFMETAMDVECPEVEAAMDVSSAEPLDSEVLYDCVICGQSGPSTEDRPTGLVVLLQASSVLGHRCCNDQAKRLPTSDDERIFPEDTCGATNDVRLALMQRYFKESSCLQSVSIGWDGGVYVQTCGHTLHIDCHKSYMESLRNDQVLQGFSVDKGEFTCPLCRQFANSVLPCKPGRGTEVGAWHTPSNKNFATLVKEVEDLQDQLTIFPTESNLTKEMESVIKDIKNATQKKYMDYGKNPGSPDNDFLFMYSVARTNLELELVHRGGNLCSGGASAAAKRSCLNQLFHVLAMHMRLYSIDSAYNPWTRLTQITQHRDSEYEDEEHPEVPMLFRDVPSLLIIFVLTMPQPLRKEHFTSIVKVLYTLLYAQALAALSIKLTPEERLAWSSSGAAKKNLPNSEKSWEALLSHVISELSKAKGVYDNPSETMLSSSVWSPQSIEFTLQQFCLPFMRLSCLLQHHLYGDNLPGCLLEEEFSLLAGGLGLLSTSFQPSTSMISALCLEWNINAFELTSQWCSELISLADTPSQQAVSLLVQDPHWSAPRLLQLPDNYNTIFQYYHRKSCTVCNKTPKDPALCLVCGAFVCLKGLCCKQQGVCECVLHSQHCGAATGIFLLINASVIIIIRGHRFCLWGSVYLDAHGEEDRDLRRGKPLFLCEERYRVLEQQWVSHTFDHINKRWGPHYNGL